MVVEGTRRGGAIPKLKVIILPACLLLALLVLAAAPGVRAQVTGGPIIDASVMDNKEFYPGQTAPILVVVQNEGYLQSLAGFQTRESLLSQNNFAVSAGEQFSASSTSTRARDDKASASYTNQSGGYVVNGVSSGDASLAGVNDASITGSATRSRNDNYQVSTDGGVEINTQTDVPLEATTALGLVCQLMPGDAPVAVVSGDRGLVGALSPGEVGGGPSTFSAFSLGLYQPIQYWIRINPDAKPGTYHLNLICTYKQLINEYSYASVSGQVLRSKNYVERTEIRPLDIVIMPRFDLLLSNIVCTDMVPDTNGIINMTVTNLGNLSVDNAVVFLMTPTLGPSQEDVNYPLQYQLLSYQAYTTEQPKEVPQNMLVPVQNSQYLGRMDPGESRGVTFKVSVSDDAESSYIPLSAVVSYTDPWEEQKSSNVKTFGVRVEPRMQFAVDAAPVDIKCGRSCVANLTLTNNGSVTARDAIVRMNALDPFTVSYDTMYLGDMKPGETRNTTFGIKVKPDAVPGTYYVTLEIKYYDSKDDPHVTKVIRKAVVIDPPPTWWDTLLENWPLVAGLAIMLAIGLAYAGYKWLKRRKTGKEQQDTTAGTGEEENIK